MGFLPRSLPRLGFHPDIDREGSSFGFGVEDFEFGGWI